jgi:hypothetical protein
MFAALVMAAACAAESSDVPAVTVRDSAGVRIVENAVQDGGPPVYAELGVPDLQIGVVHGDAAYTFTRIVDVRTLPDGAILVVDGQAQEVRIFDDVGSHVLTFGGPGSGPGEFTQIGSLAGVSGDTVRIWDGRALRLSTFLADGRFLEDRVVEGERLVSTTRATRLSDESLLLEGTAFPAPDGDPEDLRISNLLRRALPSGSLDTMVVAPGAQVAIGEETSTVIDGRTRTVRLMLQSLISYDLHVAVGEDHVFLGRNDAYRIERRSYLGVPDLVIEVPGMRYALEPSEVEEIEQRRLDLCDNEQCVEVNERSFERFPAPEWRPAFSDLRVDALGHLWVAEWEPFGVPVTGWHVFDTDGELLGRVAVPPGLEVHEVGADYILGVQENELDVPFVRRFPLGRLR